MKEYMKMLKNTFHYSGRARRREYWVPVAINAGIQLFLFGLIFLGATLAGDCLFYSGAGNVGFTTTDSKVATILCIPYILFVIYAFITQLSLTVRRFHDIGKPGWVVAICMVGCFCCCIGGIVQLVFCCFDSKEDNEWGENPKNHNEYESSGSVIGAAVIYAVLLIFCVIALFTNAFSESSSYLSAGNTEEIVGDVNDMAQVTESADTGEMDVSEEAGTEDIAENTEQAAANGDHVVISLDEQMQASIPVPSGFTVDSGNSYAYFSEDATTISFSSSMWTTKEDALDSLKDTYSPFNKDYENLVEAECAEAVETTVDGNPVYYSKTVVDYGDQKNTMYHMYIDLGAEYLLELDMDTDYDITDEQALSYAKFEIQ